MASFLAQLKAEERVLASTDESDDSHTVQHCWQVPSLVSEEVARGGLQDLACLSWETVVSQGCKVR